jgi:hypothetical protein
MLSLGYGSLITVNKNISRTIGRIMRPIREDEVILHMEGAEDKDTDKVGAEVEMVRRTPNGLDISLITSVHKVGVVATGETETGMDMGRETEMVIVSHIIN